MLDYPPLHASGDIGNNVKNSLTLPSSPVVHTETTYHPLDDCRIQVTISSGSKKITIWSLSNNLPQRQRKQT